MKQYCKPFHHKKDFKEDHRNIENFKPPTEKIQLRVILLSISMPSYQVKERLMLLTDTYASGGKQYQHSSMQLRRQLPIDEIHLDAVRGLI